MGRHPSTYAVFFFILSAFVAQSHGKRQGDALTDFRKGKLGGKSGLDTRPFEASQITAADSVDGYESQLYSQTGLKEKDRIRSLPGQPRVKFAQYGGYVTVNIKAGRAFYYYFVEAEKSESLPLLLWLNGGPGCSSLGYGAMEELGPFRVKSDGKTLFRNRYAWNRAANVLFLESPAGVGFSYSNTTSDYNANGDRRTASDNFVFLANWLERFPEYKGRDFYITGESYAGRYVPELADTIIRQNKKANRTIINLKGVMMGNAAIDDEGDNRGMYDFFGTHALTSLENMNQIQKYCNFSADAPETAACDAATKIAEGNTFYTEGIDIYNIYGPLCFDGNLTAKPKRASVTNFDPCTGSYVDAYLNTPEVQAAMHANVTKVNFTWSSCSDVIRAWRDSPPSILPLLKEFMAHGLRVWLFSGDNDGRVPVTSTEYSIAKMKLPIKTEWRPWYMRGEIAGYTQVYKGDLTFATVRGAGHEVPSYQPLRGLSLIKHFLAGTPLAK